MLPNAFIHPFFSSLLSSPSVTSISNSAWQWKELMSSLGAFSGSLVCPQAWRKLHYVGTVREQTVVRTQGGNETFSWRKSGKTSQGRKCMSWALEEEHSVSQSGTPVPQCALRRPTIHPPNLWPSLLSQMQAISQICPSSHVKNGNNKIIQLKESVWKWLFIP